LKMHYCHGWISKKSIKNVTIAALANVICWKIA
jgi:hypothetical protein